VSIEHLVVMGVSGTGKSTTATLLAERLGRPMLEGDDLHPPANVEAMRAGRALTDDDRVPWLRAIRDAMTAAGGSTVVTCSSLRRSYRDVLRTADGRVRFVHLVVPADELTRRLAVREGHFMPATLLASQLATLEPLGADEDGVDVPVDGLPSAVVDEALRLLTSRESPATP
jgi:gluconokinase